MKTKPFLLARLSGRHADLSGTSLQIMVSAASSLAVALCVQTWGRTPPAIAVTPLTTVVETPRNGYFGDPYPVSMLDGSGPSPFQLLSGTTKAILVRPEQFGARTASNPTR
jgi:hypothetical protein